MKKTVILRIKSHKSVSVYYVSFPYVNTTIRTAVPVHPWVFVHVKFPGVNRQTSSFPIHNTPGSESPPPTYLGTQLGEERSTSQVAYRFMCTGRLDVMLTGLEGCMCGEGTPPVRGSPPRSDILEAEIELSGGEKRRNSRCRSASPFYVWRCGCHCFLCLAVAVEGSSWCKRVKTRPCAARRN